MPKFPHRIPMVGKQYKNIWKDLSPKDRGCNPQHHGYMRNGQGAKLPCMWADCESPGLNKFHLDIMRGTGGFSEIEHFIFCSPLHKSLFVNSHEKLGYVTYGESGKGKFL